MLVTPHMAFLTADALEAIAEVTAENLAEFVASRHDPSLTFTNQVRHDTGRTRVQKSLGDTGAGSLRVSY